MKLAIVFLFLLALHVQAESLHCEDLARATCEQGSGVDATGKVFNENDVHKKAKDFAAKTAPALKEKFAQLLDNPKDQQFRDLSEMALGLDNAECRVSAANDGRICRDKTLNALVSLAQKESLGIGMAPLDLSASFGDIEQLLNDPAYKKIRDEYLAQSTKDLTDPNLSKKIGEDIFPKVQKNLVERIEQINMPEKVKKQIVEKIKSIKFEGTNCNNFDLGPGRISPVFVPNAFVEPLKNRMAYCSGLMLQSDSEFQMVMVIAHELTHSFDPCMIQGISDGRAFRYDKAKGNLEEQYPIKKILTCLQGDRSMQAVRNPVKPKIAPFCEDHQLKESFCDWMAVEVLSGYMEKHHHLNAQQYRDGYANVTRNFCSSFKRYAGNDPSGHPKFEKRINNILMVQPKVRTQMKCPALPDSLVYCSEENAKVSENNSSGKRKSDPPARKGLQ